MYILWWVMFVLTLLLTLGATILLMAAAVQLASYRLDPKEPSITETTRTTNSVNSTVVETLRSVLDDPLQTTNITSVSTVDPDGSLVTVENTTFYVGGVLSEDAKSSRYDTLIAAYFGIGVVFAVILSVLGVFTVLALCRERQG